MKKLIITESEIKSIKRMYGLLKESVDTELLSYGNNYIDNNNCNKIYNDLVKFQSAVESGQVQMSSDDKSELDSNLKQMNMAKGMFCETIKSKMKKEFAKQSEQNPEKLKSSMCWFAANISKPQTPLTSCSSKPDVVTPTTTNTTIQTQTQSQTSIPVTTTTSDNEGPADDEVPVDNTKPVDNTPTNTATPVIGDLNSPDKVRAFQNWMDTNHPNWAYSKKYNRNYSVKRRPNYGYGNLGPNTKKAWNNSEYKNAYLKK